MRNNEPCLLFSFCCCFVFLSESEELGAGIEPATVANRVSVGFPATSPPRLGAVRGLDPQVERMGIEPKTIPS